MQPFRKAVKAGIKSGTESFFSPVVFLYNRPRLLVLATLIAGAIALLCYFLAVAK